MRPSYHPEGLSNDSSTAPHSITQTWRKNGKCPTNTIPIRRTREEDVLRASSIKRFGKKRRPRNITRLFSVDDPNTLLSVDGHQVKNLFKNLIVRIIARRSNNRSTEIMYAGITNDTGGTIFVNEVQPKPSSPGHDNGCSSPNRNTGRSRSRQYAAFPCEPVTMSSLTDTMLVRSPCLIDPHQSQPVELSKPLAQSVRHHQSNHRSPPCSTLRRIEQFRALLF
jgi:hypothetical protein